MRKVGASWAEEAERADAEAAAAQAAVGGIAVAPDAFPSLGEAVAATATTGSRKQKKKATTMTLAELRTGKPVGPGMRNRTAVIVSETKGLTTDEMLILPTGPRERSDEELQQFGGLGGGFKGYGGGFNRGNFRDDAGDRSNYGSSYDRREPREMDNMPSRADEADTWARAKMTPAPPHSGYDDDRRREQRISDRDMPSRADEVDNWGTNKKFMPSYQRGGSNRGYDRGEDWDSSRRYSPGMDRWPTRRDNIPPPMENDSSQTERPRLVLQPRTVPTTEARIVSTTEQNVLPTTEQNVPKSVKTSPFGAARPREEVLAEKGQDWKKLEEELESKATLSGGQSSAHSSRQGTPDYSKPRVRVDPFGNAKPREVLLQERGQDYRKMDFEIEHKAINRAETEQERQLKEEIKLMAEQVEQENSMNGFAPQHVAEESGLTLKDLLAQKELDLVRLTRELDDKIRFAQKSGRPSSRSGSEYGDGERPPSRRGPRDRPHSGFSETGSPYEPASAGAWGNDRPVSRSSSRDLYQERPPSRESLGGNSRGSRDGRADVWAAAADGRPPSRTGSREMYRRNNGRPPSRDLYVSDSSSQMTRDAGSGSNTRGPDIWRRPPERATSRW